MLAIDSTNYYLILGPLVILVLLAFINQVRTKTQICQELIKVQAQLQQTNKILANIAGVEEIAPVQTNYPSNYHSSHQFQASDTKVYIGNIGSSTSEADLQHLFTKFGPIEFINIPVNKHNGKSRGYGFVTFKAAKDAEQATQLNGTEFNGRQIQVNFAKERI